MGCDFHHCNEMVGVSFPSKTIGTAKPNQLFVLSAQEVWV